uniref:Leucine rich repeat containing 74B n=1 Tax=Amphilophus citrinellus TaxID=61819 RepID=A0A3Q0SZK8_AMPCI
MRGPKDQHSSPDRNVLDEGTRQGEEGGEEEELEVEDSLSKKEAYDPTGQTCYVKACKMFQVVPVSYFLKHMQNSELALMHRGLGPQQHFENAVIWNFLVFGLLAIFYFLTMQDVLICVSIPEVDLSNNNLEDYGATAIAGMLKENSTLVSLSLSGNHFTDRSAEHLGPALITNTKLQHLNLSYNALGERAGEHLGVALSENTGLRSINLAWNCIRGRGAAMLANGLGENVFLRAVDLSYNGFGKEGAGALGQALKENNVLEELNISNNRIPPEGAIHLAMGLRVNKTIKSLNIGRNPILNAGCYGILKSIQDNPDSALEAVDFSDITVSQDFEDLYTAVKEIFPALRVNHGGRIGTFSKAKACKVLL